MVTRVYEVTCDYCGICLNRYIGKKPTMEELKVDGFVATATKVFCSERCQGDWNHDRNEKQYLNLRQNGRIHTIDGK